MSRKFELVKGGKFKLYAKGRYLAPFFWQWDQSQNTFMISTHQVNTNLWKTQNPIPITRNFQNDTTSKTKIFFEIPHGNFDIIKIIHLDKHIDRATSTLRICNSLKIDYYLIERSHFRKIHPCRWSKITVTAILA